MQSFGPDEADLTQWLQALGDEAAAAPAAGFGATTRAPGATPGPASPASAASADTPTAATLFTALYAELKRQAAGHMRREAAGHTLSATALTHEAWFRLSEQTRTQWASRGHFLGMASIMMRRILVNHALARQADKRDAERVSLTLTEAQQVGHQTPAEVVRVHDALLALEAVDPRAAKVVELKFFGGLETDEIAAVLGVSAPTVKRDWALARAWLHRELGAQA